MEAQAAFGLTSNDLQGGPPIPGRCSAVAGFFVRLKEPPDHASMIHHERSRDAAVFGVLKSHPPDAFGVEMVDAVPVQLLRERIEKRLPVRLRMQALPAVARQHPDGAQPIRSRSPCPFARGLPLPPLWKRQGCAGYFPKTFFISPVLRWTLPST
jgi:hypothetical protein